MADDFDVEVVGLPELAETLDYIPIKLSNLILTDALHEGGEVFAEAARSFAPVAPQASHKESYPGELRDSIGTVVRVFPDKNYGIAHTGPLYDKGKYSGKNRTHSPGVFGKFVEFGTRFMSAIPFMRPAYHAVRERALEAFANGIGSRMERLVSAVKSLATQEPPGSE